MYQEEQQPTTFVVVQVIEEREPRHMDADSAYLYKPTQDLFTRFTLSEVLTQLNRIDFSGLDLPAKEVMYAVRQMFAEGMVRAKEMLDAFGEEEMPRTIYPTIE